MNMELDSTYTHCVIYGEITTDTTAHRVRITRSAGYFSNKPVEPISGATLTITDSESNTYPLTERKTEPGSYYTDSSVYGVPGRTYTLNVSNVDLLGDGVLSSYTATSEIKPSVKIDSIDTEYDDDWEMWKVKAWAKDPEQTVDYYMFKTLINGTLYSDSLANLFITDDKFFNGNYTYGITCNVFTEKDTLKTGYNVTLEICGITEDYYNFLLETQMLISYQNPMFSGPPSNARTNFNNDAFGYFAAYSISSSSNKVRSGRKE